jgi:CHAD domain-containing protein
MAKNQHEYILPETRSIADFIASLQSIFTIREEPEAVIWRTFYDTFDWRLFNQGASLELYKDKTSPKVYWRAGKDSARRIQLGLSSVPRFIDHMPRCDLHKQLEPIQKKRELLPRVKLKIKRRPIVVLNDEDRIIVRLNIDEYWFRPAKTRAAHVLGRRISSKVVKGYQDSYDKYLDLVQLLELRKAPDNMLKLALAETGHSAGDYSTKLNLLLDTDEPLIAAVKEILARLSEIIHQNTPGTIRGEDAEYLHDYRVAVRKTRSAMSEIQDALPPDIVNSYGKFFSMLGNYTGPVRDIDVYLLKLDKYQKALSKEGKKQLQTFRSHLLELRKEKQAALKETLKSSEYKQAVKSWDEYLKQPIENIDESSPQNRPVYEVADKLIWELYHESLNQGNTITPESPAEDIHTLRKTCKKLRYLMEFFQSLYPARRIRELILVLKGLQDVLGDFNDYAVHIDMLKKFEKSVQEESIEKATTALIKELKKKQAAVRAGFAEQYAQYSSQDHIDEFREIFIDSR